MPPPHPAGMHGRKYRHPEPRLYDRFDEKYVWE